MRKNLIFPFAILFLVSCSEITDFIKDETENISKKGQQEVPFDKDSITPAEDKTDSTDPSETVDIKDSTSKTQDSTACKTPSEDSTAQNHSSDNSSKKVQGKLAPTNRLQNDKDSSNQEEKPIERTNEEDSTDNDSTLIHEKNNELSAESKILPVTSEEETFFDTILYLSIGLISLLGLVLIVFYQFSMNKVLQNKVLSIENNLEKLQKQLDEKSIQIKNISSQKNELTSSGSTIIGKEEKEAITAEIIHQLNEENRLTKDELKPLFSAESNRWLTLGHSAIGLNHLKSNPQLPCQDSFHIEELKSGWNLLIVCDGAGSAKKSDEGSKIVSKIILPNLLRDTDFTEFIDNKNPEGENKLWAKFSIETLKNARNELLNQIPSQDNLNDYACTVIVAVFNKHKILHFNVGDGRGGYLNREGVFKPIFVPTNGDESNSTVFLTSDYIFKTSSNLITNGVIYDNIISVFLMSDGMEDVAYLCSKFEKNVFVDPNLPFKKFFLPILEKIKGMPIDKEGILNEHWKQLLEKGSKAIENQPDDKTLVLSFLK